MTDAQLQALFRPYVREIVARAGDVRERDVLQALRVVGRLTGEQHGQAGLRTFSDTPPPDTFAWSEESHPRDDRGRFVSTNEIRRAARNPKAAEKLRSEVTNPEQRAKLDAQLAKNPAPRYTQTERMKPRPVPQYHAEFAKEHAQRLQNHIVRAAYTGSETADEGAARKEVRRAIHHANQWVSKQYNEAADKAVTQFIHDYAGKVDSAQLEQSILNVRMAFYEAAGRVHQHYDTFSEKMQDLAGAMAYFRARDPNYNSRITDSEADIRDTTNQINDTHQANMDHIWDVIEAERDKLGGKGKYNLGRYFFSDDFTPDDALTFSDIPSDERPTFYASCGFTADDAERFSDYFSEDDDGYYPGDLHRYFSLNVRDFADRSHLRRKVITNKSGKKQVVWYNPNKGKDADSGHVHARHEHEVAQHDKKKAEREKAAQERRDAWKQAHEGRSTKEELQHRKERAEPVRAAARKAYEAAKSDPGKYDPHNMADVLDTLTKAELVDHAREVGEKLGGKKAELVARLVERLKAKQPPTARSSISQDDLDRLVIEKFFAHQQRGSTTGKALAIVEITDALKADFGLTRQDVHSHLKDMQRRDLINLRVHNNPNEDPRSADLMYREDGKAVGWVGMNADQERNAQTLKAKAGNPSIERVPEVDPATAQDTHASIDGKTYKTRKQAEDVARQKPDGAVTRVGRDWMAVSPFTAPKQPQATDSPRISDLSDEEFAKRVQDAADSHHEKFGRNKTFISDVEAIVRQEFPDMTTEEFHERLRDANRAMRLTLSRADLPQVMDSTKFRNSQVHLAPGISSADAHFIVNRSAIPKQPATSTGEQPPEPGFTGTDSLGRQWVDGKLIAKQEEPTDPTHQATTAQSSAVEAAESAGATPRAVASAATQAGNSDYEFARSSAVSNAGEDLKGSARHNRNAWRGLEQAEKDGTAGQLVTRDNLLKNEPHKLSGTIESHNALAHLAAHLALNAFPGGLDQKALASYEKYGGDNKKTPEQLRAQYYEAYQTIKSAVENVAFSATDPRAVLLKVTETTRDLINKYREVPADAGGYMRSAGLAGKDRYNPVANALIDLQNRASGRTGKSIMGRIGDFGQRVKEKYGELTPETLDQVKSHVLDVMEGDSFNKTFGTGGGGPRRFTPADAYVKHATRKGGRVIDANTVKSGTDFVMNNLGMRGLQWGNSVSDDERQHHLTKTAEAFADLADVVGMPDSEMSLGGQLGLAIGARGKAGASAHYEPGTKVINLTRKSGAGSLAHEWIHALDHSLAGGEIVKSRDGEVPIFLSQRATKNSSDAVTKAMGDLRTAIFAGEYAKRLPNIVRKMQADGRIGSSKHGEPAIRYWSSPEEMLARTFERYVQHKLRINDRENTYLSGVGEGDEWHELWPNAEETAALAPAFDALFTAIRQTRGTGGKQ